VADLTFGLVGRLGSVGAAARIGVEMGGGHGVTRQGIAVVKTGLACELLPRTER